MDKITKLLKINMSNLNPVLKPVFLKAFLAYMFFFVTGIVFVSMYHEFVVFFLFVAMLMFLIVDKINALRNVCNGNYKVIEGQCQCRQGEVTDLKVMGLKYFGAGQMDVLGTDGHIYKLSLPLFNKYHSGDSVRIYATIDSIGQRDNDTFSITNPLHIEKMKNAAFTQN